MAADTRPKPSGEPREACLFDATTTLDAPSGAALRLHVRRAAAPARGIVLVFHGLAEHSARYARLAGELSARGFHVMAHDHRGHGATSARDAPFRRFAARNGAAKVLADCRAVHAHALARHPGLPVVVLGHSMGGLVAMNYAEEHGRELAGVAAWNCDLNPGLDEMAARLALRAERALKGSDVASAILRRATFDAWGRSVTPRRTPFDWLSHDEAAVDAYVADPLCGFSATVSMMEDVLSLIEEGGSARGLARLPSGLPVHLLGGTADPVTDGGKATERLARRLKKRGLADVTIETVAGARHETLNEAEPWRGQALASLTGWLDRVTGGVA